MSNRGVRNTRSNQQTTARPTATTSQVNVTATTAQSQEDQLVSASIQASSKICETIITLNGMLGSIKDGDSTVDQKLEAIRAMRDVICSDTAKTASLTGKICSENISKRLQNELISQQPRLTLNNQLTMPTATAYKFTFKAINMDANRPIIKPLDELYDATGHLDVQVLDSYASPNGHVICVQTREMFLNAKQALAQHLVQDETPLTHYFEIRDQITSAYSIKTDPFDKEILSKSNLLSIENNLLTLKVPETIIFLRSYNKGWFQSDGDIENVEAFNLNKPNNSKITLKIHISLPTFNRFLSSLVTNIMLYDQKVRIWEQLPVTQCMRCCGFGHLATLCTAPRAYCRFCGADDKGSNGHRSKNCPNRNDPFCCNCAATGLSGQAAKHPATSFACDILKREADTLRKNAKSKVCTSFLFN